MKTVALKVSLKRDEDGRWSATVPGLKGCPSWGYSEQEAMANIKDAAEVFIKDMMEAGEDLQELPGPIEVIDEPAVAINL
jgi:predicted RNase H-like HicB family nuclease